MPSAISGKIKCKSAELSLNLTLLGGQSFRWKLQSNVSDNLFVGVAHNHLWELHMTKDFLNYKVFPGDLVPKAEEHYTQILRNYLRLDFNLEEHFNKWKSSHKHFRETSSAFQAVRVLDQDPLENVISFICSQNNHIKRISTMVEWLCSSYGQKIYTYQGTDYYSFPSLESLLKAEKNLEESLRSAKFGYRAKFIAGAINKIHEFGGMKWFANLKDLPYEEARQELVKLPGIGFKVADCICLMSLDCLESVPIDTHIYKIAQNSYMPNLKSTKSVTPKVYEEVASHFRKIYGEYAGWAQAVLFCSGLQQFQENKEKDKVKKRKKE